MQILHLQSALAVPLNTSPSSFLIFPFFLLASSTENYFTFRGGKWLFFFLFPFFYFNIHLPGRRSPFRVLAGSWSPKILPSWLFAAESATNWAITHKKASSAAVSKPLPHLGLKKIIPAPNATSDEQPGRAKSAEKNRKGCSNASVCRWMGVPGREEAKNMAEKGFTGMRREEKLSQFLSREHECLHGGKMGRKCRKRCEKGSGFR